MGAKHQKNHLFFHKAGWAGAIKNPGFLLKPGP